MSSVQQAGGDHEGDGAARRSTVADRTQRCRINCGYLLAKGTPA